MVPSKIHIFWGAKSGDSRAKAISQVLFQSSVETPASILGTLRDHYAWTGDSLQASCISGSGG
jgi:hypothetical protein